MWLRSMSACDPQLPEVTFADPAIDVAGRLSRARVVPCSVTAGPSEVGLQYLMDRRAESGSGALGLGATRCAERIGAIVTDHTFGDQRLRRAELSRTIT